MQAWPLQSQDLMQAHTSCSVHFIVMVLMHVGTVFVYRVEACGMVVLVWQKCFEHCLIRSCACLMVFFNLLELRDIQGKGKFAVQWSCMLGLHQACVDLPHSDAL